MNTVIEAATQPISRLKKMFKKMCASWIRAVVTIVGSTQLFNAYDARGLNSLLVSLGISFIAPFLVFLTGAADLLEEK